MILNINLSLSKVTQYLQDYHSVVKLNDEGIQFEYRRIFSTKRINIPITDILGIDSSTTDTILKSVEQISAKHKRKYYKIDYSSMGNDGNSPKWARLIRKFVKSKGIIIKSREGQITFGEGLPDEEVKYIVTIINRVLGRRNKNERYT